MAPPPGTDPAKMQQIQQFLTSVLSQRGPTALPYADTTKWLIRQHLLTLISSYSSLEPKTATFTHNDGRSAILLQADGTVPMPYQGVSYNIPVVVWLLESYPRDPPRVYVNPTRDMIIKRPHSNVSPSGLVSLPYLHAWVYPSSNLLDLAAQLSSAFSRDPPLYSQRRPPPQSSPSIGSGYSRPSPSPPIGSGYARPPPPSYHQQQQQTDDAAEVYKRNAINKLVEMVHVDLVTMRSAREAEAEGLLSLQATLERREGELARGLREMVSEKETLEQELQVVSMNTDVLDSWVRENQGRSKTDLDDVDSAFVCLETMSRQMLECTASDLAIDDAVYAMDKSFRDGVLPFDQYLRSVRLLSREQFFHRAKAEKVRGMQMEAQVASIAARLQL
ncbi:Protein ELC-like [Raphanus sativus]|uniref:Protein ELC-like n=1 Tax=Raphanus sativus TaxID=3726 RepID=A0A6J0KE37_RAPSA|nr:protein ELC-like [Raphanus sativus]KAJ4912016.1 Protein ELC-like [Raphanus sativus]